MLDITRLSTTELYELAENENTPSETLIELSEEKNREILQRLAKNPNTPISILERLSYNFPDEVINNPVCELLWLENPNQMDFYKVALAKSSSTSEAKLIQLAEDSNTKIKNALLERKSLSVELLKKLATDSNVHVRQSVSYKE